MEMKPLIIVCNCGKVRRFGEWIIPTAGQSIAINSGTYQKQIQTCGMCQLNTGKLIKHIPVAQGANP
jgi:hypothetical protein